MESLWQTREKAEETRGREPRSGGLPSSVQEVSRQPGAPLDSKRLAFMEPRFGHDFSRVRVHSDEQAAHSARSVGAATLPALQRQEENEDASPEQGIEVGDELQMLPRWSVMALPDGGNPSPPLLQRAPATACETPSTMRKVTSGKFEGGKTLDDYYPDLVGAKIWGKNDTAGTFDNGSRAGSSVQLIGEYPAPCITGGSPFTLGQNATIVRARANGAKLMEGGKALEGQTINDIQRSGRDASKPPFRQEFGFAVSMADPISGIPYAPLQSYEWEVNLTSSLTGAGGTKSVDWGVTVEASKGKVTKNELR